MFLDVLKKWWDRHRAVRWAFDVALLLLLVAAVGWYQTRQHFRGPAPEYVFQTLEGGVVKGSTLLGKATVLVVWAPWCKVCKLESDNISRVARWLDPKVNVISVATSFNDISEVREFMRVEKVDYPVLLADDDFTALLNVKAFPTVFIINAQGHIVSSTEGYTPTLTLAARALWAARSF